MDDRPLRRRRERRTRSTPRNLSLPKDPLWDCQKRPIDLGHWKIREQMDDFGHLPRVLDQRFRALADCQQHPTTGRSLLGQPLFVPDSADLEILLDKWNRNRRALPKRESRSPAARRHLFPLLEGGMEEGPCEVVLG